MTVLYIPVIALFTSMLVSCEGGCWTGAYATRSAFVIVISLFYILLSLTFAVAVFQQDATDPSELLSRPHSRCEVYHLLVKTVLTICFVSLEHHHQYHWLLIALSVFGSSSLWLMYTWFLPFYRWTFAVFRTVTMAIVMWASLCLVVVKLLNDPEHNSVSVMFFFALPVIVMVAIFTSNARKTRVKTMPVTPTINPLTIELKARFILEDNNMLFSKHAKELVTDGMNTHDQEKAANEKLVVDQITELYNEASVNIPNSSILYMFWANFSLHHAANKQRSLYLLEECLKRNPQVDELFVAFRQKKVMNEDEGSGHMDMLDLIIGEVHMKKAAKHERKAVSLQMQFWNELLSPSGADLQKLFVIGTKINSETHLADYHYSKSISSNPKSSAVLKNYSAFLMDVCNDQKRSLELHERAKNLDDLKRRANAANDGMIDIATLMSSTSETDTAVFTINHLGIIQSVTSGVSGLLGYDKPQILIGRNISSIVPPPFDKIHDEFLSNYLKKGEGQVISKIRKIFAVSADGYLIPVMLLVRQLTFGVNGTFVGVIKSVPEGSYTYDYILLDSDGNLKSFSPRCTEYFGTTPSDATRFQLHISDWIENYSEVENLMKQNNGYTMEIAGAEGNNVQLNCTQVSITISGISISLIKLVNQNSLFTSKAGQTDDIRSQMPMTFYVDASKYNQKNKKETMASQAVPKSMSVQSPEKMSTNERKSEKKAKSPKRKAEGSENDRRDDESESSKRSSLKSPRSYSPSKMTDASRRESQTPSNIDQKSQHSAASQTSTVVNQLMRNTFTKKIQSTSKRLRTCGFVLLGIMITSIFLVIGEAVYLNNLYQGNLKAVLDVEGLAEVEDYAFQAVTKLVDFVRDAPSLTLNEKVQRRDQVLQLTDSLNNRFFGIYDGARGLPAEIQNTFTKPTIKIYEYGANTSRKETITISLNDAINLFVSQTSRLAKTAVTDNSTLLDVGNGPSILLDSTLSVLDHLVYLYARNVENYELASERFYYIILLAPMGLLEVMTIVVVLLIFWKTTSESKLIYKFFLDVQKDVIKSMLLKSKEKLASLDKKAGNSLMSDRSHRNAAKDYALFDMDRYIIDRHLDAKQKQDQAASTKVEGHKKTSYEVANLRRLCLRVFLYILILSGFIGGFALYSTQFLSKSNESITYFAWSSNILRLSRETDLRLSLILAEKNGSVFDNTFSRTINTLNFTANTLERAGSAFYIGNNTLSMPDFYTEISRPGVSGFSPFYLVNDIAFDQNDHKLLDDPDCDVGLQGAMTRGFMNSIFETVETLYDIVGAVKSINQPVDINALNEYMPVVFARSYAGKCVPAGMRLFQKFLTFEIHQAVALVGVLLIPLVATFVSVLMLLVYFLGFKPVLRTMEHEVSLTPSMLLMLPPHALMKVDAIKNFISDKNTGK